MRLARKTAVFLGDSITEGVGVNDIWSHRFDRVLKRTCGLKEVYNYGISGTRYAHQRTSSEWPRFDASFCARALDMKQDADIVIVFGGTNDYGHGDAPFGTPSDTTPATFCGAARWLMRTLKETYTKAEIVILTPSRRQGGTLPCANTGRPLSDYRDEIRKAAAETGVHLLDVYDLLGVDPDIDEDREAYTSDGLHLNDADHEKLAALVRGYLTEL